MIRRWKRYFLLLLAGVRLLAAADAVTPGKFVVERPTLICLGFEWQSPATTTGTQR